MLTGFLFLGGEAMKLLYVIIAMLILSGLCLSQDENFIEDDCNLEIYEISLVDDMMADIKEYLETQVFKYGFQNEEIVEYIGTEILEKKYNLILKDYSVLVIGDPKTYRPKRVIVAFSMVFRDYLFKIENINVEEKSQDEKARSKGI